MPFNLQQEEGDNAITDIFFLDDSQDYKTQRFALLVVRTLEEAIY
jgi:hypothetical protein